MNPAQIVETIDGREALFWSRVAIGNPNECWPWVAGRQSHGYGRFSIAPGVQESSHRIALALSLAGGPDDAHALHSCDNPPCCNPAHLRWGTPADNSIDKMTRGRAKPGRAMPPFCPAGHAMKGDNILHGARAGKHGRTYSTNSCRECNRLYLARRRAIRKDVA